jgi:curli production assembly/transport component CsgF
MNFPINVINAPRNHWGIPFCFYCPRTILMETLKRQLAFGCLVSATVICMKPVCASEMVYQPNNPSFGGNPLNGAVLLNSANAQNRYTAPSSTSASSGYTAPSALDTFNQRLQSMILDRIATSITGSVFDASGRLLPGTVETSNFSISIADIGNGMLRITTIDKTTGASTTFEVNNNP